MNNINNENINDNFIKAKKNIGICNLSNAFKYTIYGPNAVDLLNKFSVRKVNDIKEKSFMTILMKKKKYICECQIIRLSPLKYLILTFEDNNLFKLLKKYSRKFPLVTVDNSDKLYSFFSFHGDTIYEYFKKNTSASLYPVNRQGYIYYTLLTTSVNKFAVLDHFKSLGFIEINPYVRNIFMYNNNVITDLNKIIKKYRLNIYSYLYKADNLSFKKPKKIYCVKQFETTHNLVLSNMPIYNHKRRKIGYIHNFYRLPNKKNPFILGIVKRNKIDKIAILKYNKNEILIKDYLSH